MPRALKVTEITSRFFPKVLTLLYMDDQKPPELSAETHREIIKLHVAAWRLWRARKRKNAAEDIEKAVRTELLDSINSLRDVNGKPFSLYGFVVRRRRGAKTRFVPIHSTKVVDNAGFIQYLGEHASSVITGFSFDLERLIKEPGDLNRLLGAVAKEFGDEAAGAIVLSFSSDRLKKLIKEDPELGPPPRSVLEKSTTAIKVTVDLVDPITGERVGKK